MGRVKPNMNWLARAARFCGVGATMAALGSTLGCVQLIGLEDVAPPSEDASMPDGAGDGAPAGDDATAPRADGGTDSAALDSASASDGQGAPPGACTPGGTCAPSECQSGEFICGDAGRVCLTTSQAAD